MGDSSLKPDVASLPLHVPLLSKPISPSPPVLLPPHLPTPLHVYKRRPQPSTFAPPSSLPSPDPMPLPASDHFPIALRKGKRSCTTQHPMSQFVSTSSLSHSLSCFIFHLFSVSIPKTAQAALSNSG